MLIEMTREMRATTQCETFCMLLFILYNLFSAVNSSYSSNFSSLIKVNVQSIACGELNKSDINGPISTGPFIYLSKKNYTFKNDLDSHQIDKTKVAL